MNTDAFAETLGKAMYFLSEAQQYQKSRDSDIELAKANAMVALAHAINRLADSFSHES